MKESQSVIGLDIGTMSAKAVVFGRNGRVRGQHAVDYPLIKEHPSWAEQEPEQILQAALLAVSQAISQAGAAPQDIAAVGLSSAMHSLIVMDREGGRLTRSITWADNRSSEQAERLRASELGREIYRRTGTPIHAMSPLPKLLWLREHRPDLFRAADKFISIKEYIVYRLFGQYVVDTSIASATGLLSLEQLDYDAEALRLAGIDRGQLAQPVPATYMLSGMDAQLASHMGVAPGTPFVLGASDGALANVGVGATRAGEVAVTIGTSGAIRTVTDRPLTDPQQRTFCYSLTESWFVVGGATNNGGIVMRWLRDQFGTLGIASPGSDESDGDRIYELMMDGADKVPPGAQGLLFLPYLTGDRAPIWNASARGVFFGAGLQHRSEHFIRAAMEGVLFNLLSVALALESLTGPPKDIRASGGFARSALWRQMLADILGREVLVPASHEASALGAAVIALIALGELKDIHEAKDMIDIRDRHSPQENRTRIYRELHGIFERIYTKVKDEFAQISSFQERCDNG